MSLLRITSLASAAALLAVLAAGCGSGSSSCSDSRTCGTGGSAWQCGVGRGRCRWHVRQRWLETVARAPAALAGARGSGRHSG